MKNVGIVSVGSYVPEKVLTNFDLEKMVETTDDWITTRTGIKERRIAAKGERTSHLAIKAANDVLKRAKLDPQKVELIIVATISPDSNFPSVACLVQKAIGAHNATAFDVSAACAGSCRDASCCSVSLMRWSSASFGAAFLSGRATSSSSLWRASMSCSACRTAVAIGDGLTTDENSVAAAAARAMPLRVDSSRRVLS